MSGDDSWRTPSSRQSMILKIEEAIQSCGSAIGKNATELENHVFSKANTREDYINFIYKLVNHVKQMNNNKKINQGGLPQTGLNSNQGVQQGIQDPMSALQTLTRQGGNERPMNIPGQGPNPQVMMQQGPNQPTNLLQSLNQRPGQPPMNMQGMHNKVPGMGVMPGGQAMVMNQMGMAQMQGNPMMAQMNSLQGNMQQQMSVPPGQQQIPGGQMGGQTMGTVQVPQPMQGQIPNQMTTHQMGGQMGPGMPGGMGPQQPVPQQQQTQQHMGPMNPAQVAANQLTQQQMMQRKTVEMMNAGFPGPRNVTPTQFLRQSPSPSAPSPGGLGIATPASSQMVASPALVPSPNPQHAMLGPRSVGMVSSPSSSLNTPAGMSGATPSPLQDDQGYQAYKEKIRKLSKYIDPLRKLILKTTKEGNTEKMSKMKKLLEILTNPSSSTKLDVLNKCEIVLEKMDFKKFETGSIQSATMPTNIKEHHLFTPLLEVVNNVLQSPIANHTLQRTFGPCLEALFGPDIKGLPPPMKKQKIEEQASDIPDILQGEIARLDQRFKISLDPTQQTGSKCIHLICWIDDKHLPCVPPISVIVPADYPLVPPHCVLLSHEYTTPYLSAVENALDARLGKLPKTYSVSQLLDTWEMSVRQASAPKAEEIADTEAVSTVSNSVAGTTSATATTVSSSGSSNAAMPSGVPSVTSAASKNAVTA